MAGRTVDDAGKVLKTLVITVAVIIVAVLASSAPAQPEAVRTA